MSTTYTIGRLAEAADVPVSTIRYYERRGLLAPDQRTRASYRIYTAGALHRLRFIKAAQSSGFTLEDIRLLQGLRDGTADSCGEVRGVVAQRLQAVGERLRELRRVERVLRDTLSWCDGPRPHGCCPAILLLEAAASRDAEPATNAVRRGRRSDVAYPLHAGAPESPTHGQERTRRAPRQSRDTDASPDGATDRRSHGRRV